MNIISMDEFKNKMISREIKKAVYVDRHYEDLTIHVYACLILINSEYRYKIILVEWV
jgi:hypothetical protein